MLQINEIELSSIETTAYWWIRTIRNKVREIAIFGARDDEEIKFAEIFYYYTDIDWRNLYLNLINDISEDVNNYIPLGNVYGIDAFNQDTNKSGHNRINSEIAKIIKQHIPDIRLASKSQKDSVIYTDLFAAYEWYKSCGTNKLPKKYPSSYILTGNENILNFYNLLMATIVTLETIDRDFESISILREQFCKEYLKNNEDKESIENLTEMFNSTWQKANDDKIILGRYFQESYCTHFHDIDLVGLQSYMNIAEHYANIILEKNIKIEEKLERKMIKPDSSKK